MKARITFVLFAAAVLFAGTAMAAEPAADIAPSQEEPQMTTPDEAVGEQDPLFMAPPIQICNHPEPSPNFCDRWDSSSCDYEWDCECCCRAVYAAPGALCGPICI